MSETAPRQRYTVSLTRTHWESLMTQGRLRAWVEARQMGMTVEQCDRIADAAVAGVRETIEEWAQQQLSAGPARPDEGLLSPGRYEVPTGVEERFPPDFLNRINQGRPDEEPTP